MLSTASSTASHHRAASGGAGVGTSSGSPAPQLRGIMRRSFSTKDLFEAQADAVTAQAQVQGLHLALKRVSRAGRWREGRRCAAPGAGAGACLRARDLREERPALPVPAACML